MTYRMWTGLVVIAVIAYVGPSHGFRISFGSCNCINKTNPFWPLLSSRKPDFWIWGGDNIYADSRPGTIREYIDLFLEDPSFVIEWMPQRPWSPATFDRFAYLYKKQSELPEYKSFIKQVGIENVAGIWDDHDYGINDGGKEFFGKDISQEAFLNFFQVPLNDPRRHRKGIYSHRDIADGRIRIILLDNRYFKDDFDNKTGDMLGVEQWKWLGNTLEESTADVNIIVSGIQVLPMAHLRSLGENWQRLPLSREKLLKVVSSTNAKGVLFISGDVHQAEFLQANCTCADSSTFGLPEITSSGMTHSWKTLPKLISWGMESALKVHPTPFLLPNSNYLGMNVGEMDISFDSRDSFQIHIKILDPQGNVRLQRFLTKHELKQGAGKNCTCLPFRGSNASVLAQLVGVVLFVITALLPVLAVLSFVVMCVRLLLHRSVHTKTE
mmetsp:Transcript_11590/g.18852  ORF Transcript_11590/g.18852 Transcript_11590/m.18852 type:complete len:439 (-) Transcript_11590:1447-2763(-)